MSAKKKPTDLDKQRAMKASDLMQQVLLTLREDSTLKEAVQLLEDYHISGAPVLNAVGECIGVFSAADILRRGVEVDSGEEPRAGEYFSTDPFSDDLETYTPKDDWDAIVLGPDTVAHWMSTDLRVVKPVTSVEDVCRRMADDRIHRVLVMDGKKLLGIITSFDIVSLVAGREG